MIESWEWDPDYPVDGGSEDGLDPYTREELRRIKEQEDRDNEVPDLPM